MEIANGRYRLIRRLGAGGTGVVYQAADVLLGRTVAVKALHARFAPDLLRREGRSLAQLNHPHIVALYDLVESDQQLYLIMEYVDGYTLEGWLAEHGPLAVEQALSLFGSIAGTIAAAHAGGVLHCDLTPTNVLLATNGEVKLTDFTLARIQVGNRFEGVDGGNPTFAAPEQLVGGTVDRRTDVYALGKLLDRMLAVDARASDREEQVVAVIARATRTAPEERFADVDELLAALPVTVDDVTRVMTPSVTSNLTRVASVALGAPAGPQPTRRALPWRLGAAGMALLIAGGALFNHFTASASTTTVTVPPLAGTPYRSADLILRSSDLRPQTTWRYASAAVGTVIAQQPAAESRVARAADVILMVSRGPRPILVPELGGEQVVDASRTLQQRGFRVVVQTSDTVFHSSGEVLNEDPIAGSTRLPHSTVILTVAKKPWWWVFGG